jgi:hypothetical protein
MRKRGRLSSRQHNQKNAGGESLKFENCQHAALHEIGRPAKADAAKGGVVKGAPSWMADDESGLTRATATGMTLPHIHDVLVNSRGRTLAMLHGGGHDPEADRTVALSSSLKSRERA